MLAVRTLISFSLVFVAFVAGAAAQTVDQPVRAVTDPGVIPTRQAITPAGVPTIFQGRVYGIAYGKSAEEIWVQTASHIYCLDWRRNRVVARIPWKGTPGLQGIHFDAAAGHPWFAGTAADHKVRLGRLRGTTLELVGGELGEQKSGALAVAPGKLAAVPLTFNNALALVDLSGTAGVRKVSVGIAPFGVAMNKAATVAYVSNWGGRHPEAGDKTAPTGLDPQADRVVVDSRGIASTGTVTRVDIVNGKATHTIPVGLHPTAIVWDEKRGRVYVANSNSDSISVIDAGANSVVATFALRPFAKPMAGIAPTALALSRDGGTLYVACGGINAVAQVNTSGGQLEGLIPTGWYPNALAISPDGASLAVGTLLGAGSGWRDEPRRRFVHSYRGSVHVLPLPDQAQLASYTTAVAENNRVALGRSSAPTPAARKVKPVAIPARSGEPSLIEHVVYIIKENRTYDQVLGDLPAGNGDPSLVMFGRDVTPNQHKLAEQFVILDNFYVTGGNSGDGHQWLTQANETAYCLWPGYVGRSYPFDGTDPIAYSANGFIWDAALAAKKTVRVYGEYAGRLSEAKPEQRLDLLERWRKGEKFLTTWNIVAPLEPLNRILAAHYPSYTNAIPDVVRADIFLADLAEWRKQGKMPNFIILQLPCDHTFGTRPGASTPRAMVADNDLALGRIVEGLSQSEFWKKMAIFVVEDDAQNGVDHVDGHRTVALVASPYARRNHVDSTFYSDQSMLKTIELILGLPSLSLFDLIANDMRASFTNTPDFGAFIAEIPRQSLFELNPPVQALRGPARQAALDSERMRWDVPDAVPTERLNRILWGAIKGWTVAYPAPPRAAFAPLSLDIDDEDREQR